MKINYKIILVGLIPMLLFIYFAVAYMKKNIDIQKNQIFTEVSDTIQERIKVLIKEKEESVLLISTSLSANQNIRDVLITKNVDDLDLKEFSLKLRENSSFRNVWFQIISVDGVSLYRSWTDKRGDSLLEVRKDIKKMLELPRIISTISTGKYDMTFKSMVPIYHNNKFIGIIETIAKFNSISQKLEDKGNKNVILVDKKYKKQLTNTFTGMFVQDYYVANLNADKMLLKLIEKRSVEYFINLDKYSVEDDLLIVKYTLKDVDGANMTYFIVAQSIDDIDLSDVENETKNIIFVFVLIFISIGVMLYYFYIVNYKNFILKQNKILEDSVEDKTKELKEKSEVLKHQAEHDALTMLPNRLLFFDRLKQAIKHAKRRDKNVSVLFLDLDRFKDVNDTYGHEAGDKLLKRVTTRLQKCVRDEDTVARLGGDEFTIILQNLKQREVVKIVDKIMHAMQEPFYINDVELYTTFSIGISNFPEDGDTPEILLRNADTAMYKAKDNGKNNYQFYNEEMTKFAFMRMELEKDIRRALSEKEFVSYFQPKMDAVTNKVIGLEALVRWMHPQKGIVYPDKFIEFAEEIGVISEIDNFMMQDSMKKVKEWKAKGLNTGMLSVNISAKQLSSKDYISEVKDMLQSVDFDPHDLEIEITESQIMDNPEKAIVILNSIRSLGVTISIDDFGTGYSSLAYLKKLPIGKLKIDRSFISELPEDKDDIAIVKTIISFTANLGMDIIAEGVETKEQVDFLLKEGCRNIQGYYFSKPLSVDDCEKYLASH
jgi:diguanylate cyclase (GGDEF)-like protein